MVQCEDDDIYYQRLRIFCISICCKISHKEFFSFCLVRFFWVILYQKGMRFLIFGAIFESWVKNNTSQSQYLQGIRGIIVSL